MYIENFLEKLSKIKSYGNGKYMALCPCHDDKVPSLSIGIGKDGRILLYCHAGCSTRDVLNALGLEMKDLYSEESRKNYCCRNQGGKYYE